MSTIYRPDGPDEKRLVIVEGLLQILRITEAFGDQATFGIDQPRRAGKVVPRMEYGPLLPPGHLRDSPHRPGKPGTNPASEHRPVPRPAVLVDITTIIQRVPRNIGERIAHIPVAVQTGSLHIRSAKELAFPITTGHPHRRHLLHFLAIAVRVTLTPGQDGGMTMVRDYDINDHDDVLPPGSETNNLDKGIIIPVITTQHGLLQTLQTDMEGLDIADGAVREHP